MYSESKADALRPDLIAEQDELLTECRKGTPNLSYAKALTKECMEILFAQKYTAFKLKRFGGIGEGGGAVPIQCYPTHSRMNSH